MTNGARSRRTRLRRERTPFEWAILVLSIGTAATLVIGLAVSEVSGGNAAADLRVRAADVGGSSNGGRTFEVTVSNLGETSAENVIVEVTVDGHVREVHLPLVARGEHESATVVVPANAAGEARTSVVSFTHP
jgi:uncharacterized protein (TIGR02588 family)